MPGGRPDEGTGRHEWSGRSAIGQELSGAMVAAQAGGKTAGAERTRRLPKRRIASGAGAAKRRCRAGIRSLQPAEARGTDGNAPISPRFCAKAFPNICAMRPCENPGRWIPRSAITSIQRSNTPMTGIRRAAFPAAANSAQASMSRGWCRRSWATPAAEIIRCRSSIPEMRRQILRASRPNAICRQEPQAGSAGAVSADWADEPTAAETEAVSNAERRC